jgi:DNA invertase Pin-like site-specific DNA recombinase
LLPSSARVSTDDQDLEGQRRRLKKAGAIRIFEDVMSGKRFEPAILILTSNVTYSPAAV